MIEILQILYILWNIISVISVLITIVSFIYPNNQLTKILYRKIKERQLKNSMINIQITQKYSTNTIKEIEEYKSIIKKLFSEYNLIVEVTDNLIKGNMKRMNFHISNKIRIPTEDENFIIYIQQVDINYNQTSDCLNTLFDNIRLLEKSDSLYIDFDKIKISVSSPIFKNNTLINLLGNRIEGNFIIEKKEEDYVIIYNGYLTQETIHDLKNIILSIAIF